MDDVEKFSKALNAIAQDGAYSAKDIRQICAQEVQCREEPILWVDNIPWWLTVVYGVLLGNGIQFYEIPRQKDSQYMKHTFIFSCTDNGGGHQTFEVRATDKQEAIRKGMKTAKKFACGDICGDWECRLKKTEEDHL